MYMDPNSEELYTIIDRAIDEAMLNGRFLFNMKTYLTAGKWTRKQVGELIDSSSMDELTQVVDELSQYIARDKYMSEAYDNVPKPQARKIRKYFQSLIDDAKEYYDNRKPGRPRKPAK
tara:strand:+ start:6693 stop:7046 length:354 start_codon:yes stop_codon:yes gene_type:complete